MLQRQSVAFARVLSELRLSERTSFLCCQPLIAANSDKALQFHVVARHLAVEIFSTALANVATQTMAFFSSPHLGLYPSQFDMQSGGAPLDQEPGRDLHFAINAWLDEG